MEIFRNWDSEDCYESGATDRLQAETVGQESGLFADWETKGTDWTADQEAGLFAGWESKRADEQDVEKGENKLLERETEGDEAELLQPGCLPVPTGEEKPILRRSGGSKKIGIREICEASAEYLHLIRVDGKLYHRMGTYFQKLDPAALGKFLFAQLPEEFAGALYNVSMEKVFKKLEATDLVEDQSMEEIRVRFSDFVALENGYYNVSSGDFYPDLEAYREIICLTGICANYQRNPEATPVFDAFIDRVSDGDERRRERFLDFLAVILMTGKKAKKFYVLGVAPDSGKSTIANLMEAFFPLGAISRMDIHDLGRNFALAAVAESSVNISMDLTAEPLKARAVSNIKLLTGEYRVQVEEKFKQSRVTNCCGKLVFGTNHSLALLSPDPALFNRLEVIPVTRQIPVEEQNPNLQAQLLVEIDGIVSKLLRRTMRLCEGNLELTPCPLATKMKREWMESSEDLIAAFIKEFCIITNNPEDYLESAELHELYIEYCMENGMNPEATNAFTRRVRKLISPECGRFSREKRPEGGGLPVRIVRGLTWRIDNEYEEEE